MIKIKVIPYKKYVNKYNGRVLSKFSVLPGDRDDWELVTKGYTWEHTDHRGTVTEGLCRVPAKTIEEANEIALKFQAAIPNTEVELMKEGA